MQRTDLELLYYFLCIYIESYKKEEVFLFVKKSMLKFFIQIVE